MGHTLLALVYMAFGAAAQSTAGAYEQCGGTSYSGATACGSGYKCTIYNAYYAQCVPGATTSTAATSTTPLATATPTSTTTTQSSSNTTVSTEPATTLISTTVATATGSGTPTTLVSGWYWIRGVETPYYHSYLQTLPTDTPGAVALMDSYETAGQFNIIDGQLVYNTGSGASAGALYMNVEDPTDKTQRALATWFNATENSYGSFAFSGDTVTWTDPDVTRPNTAAFYVCPDNSTTTGENALFVNTGAYLYDTPSGCYDVDIHYYGASTATL